MDALSEAIVRLLRRVEGIENRLAAVERGLPLETAAPAPQAVEELQLSVAEAAPPSPPLPPKVLFEPPPQREPSEARKLESRLGLTWINRIGVVTMALAVAFFFKYAVDNRWIGERGRVLLGLLAGLLALAFAEWTNRAGHRIYSQGLCGLGITILYLSFYASFGFYRLVPQPVAFLLMTSTTAMAGALALYYNAAAILTLGLLGGYATPILLSTGEDRPWFLFGYVMLLNLGALWASRPRKWRRIEALAFLGTVTLYSVWLADRFQPGKEPVATFWAFAYYALFALSRAPSHQAAAQILAVAVMLAVWSQKVAFQPLALILSGAGLAAAALRNRPWLASIAFGTYWILAFAWIQSVSAPRPVGAILLWLTSALLLFLAWLPWRVLRQRAQTSPQDLVLLAANGLAYFSICYDLLRPDYRPWLGLFTVALAGLHLFVGYELWRRQPADRRDLRPVLLCAGLAVIFLTLAAPIQFAGYRITIAWSLEAAALVWIGARTGSRRLSYAAFLVFILALGRLLFLDSWIYRDASAYAAILNLRFLTFLVCALSMWLASNWVAERVEKLATYAGGHAVLLWALILDVVGWADRTAAPENVVSVRSAAISILLMCYALLLVATGVLARSGATRLLGLGLVALVVLKLYLSDVWLLRRIYRVTAFAVLGLLLLVTSFLYSRYRGSIESWWKDEKAGS